MAKICRACGGNTQYDGVCDDCYGVRKVAARRAKRRIERIYGNDYPVGIDEFDYYFEIELRKIYEADKKISEIY